jgi:hypothetical protein
MARLYLVFVVLVSSSCALDRTGVMIARGDGGGCPTDRPDRDGDGTCDPACVPASPPLELCDGIDNDCLPSTADGAAEIGMPCDGPDEDLCAEGFITCVDGVRGCTDNTDSTPDVCGGGDDDCDGRIDESVDGGVLVYPDEDRYGYGAIGSEAYLACSVGPGQADNADDCDDSEMGVRPGAADVCDGIDNDCSGLADDVAACPCASAAVADRTFLFCHRAVRWRDADAVCMGYGGRLASIHDATEDRLVLTALQRLGIGNAWIGLNDRGSEGTWRWADGSEVDYLGFGGTEPNGGGLENCADASPDFGYWVDLGCPSLLPVVCALPRDP